MKLPGACAARARRRRQVVGDRALAAARHRTGQRAVPLVDERLERRVDVVDAPAERLGERLRVLGAGRVRGEQRAQPCFAVELDQMLDDQRRLEVRERQRSRAA